MADGIIDALGDLPGCRGSQACLHAMERVSIAGNFSRKKYRVRASGRSVIRIDIRLDSVLRALKKATFTVSIYVAQEAKTLIANLKEITRTICIPLFYSFTFTAISLLFRAVWTFRSYVLKSSPPKMSRIAERKRAFRRNHPTAGFYTRSTLVILLRAAKLVRLSLPLTAPPPLSRLFRFGSTCPR